MKLENIVILSGPSGAGEDSIIAGLGIKTRINRVITTTTREKRPGESDGSPYYFISKDAFEDTIRSNEMIEWAKQYNDNLYGVTKSELERVNSLPGVGVWKIEYQGVISAKKLFPEIKAIFIMADSLEVLAERIRKRGNVSESYIQERMEYTKEWLKHQDIYDYKVINRQGKLDEAIAEVMEILRKEGYNLS
ncbi:MAG TPA: guanylate kinase [Candidatus Paceibacterota bacterium]|nr:guanylate kinase [Candidatus Paceibacterota bacterium]